MRRRTLRGLVSALGLVLVVAVASPAHAEPTPPAAPAAPAAPANEDPMIRGVVDSIDSSRIVVDGVAHVIHSDTTFENRGNGARIDPARITPGITVDLEIGHDGRLQAVRAIVPG